MNAIDIAGIDQSQLLAAFQEAVAKPMAAFPSVAPCTVRTFWGGSMAVFLPEAVSMEIAFRSGVYERDLTLFLIKQLRSGMTFFDIGAHFGYFTLLGSHIVGEAGQVHSFEPTPSTHEILSHNVKSQSNVKLNRLAMYSGPAEMTFQDYGISACAFNTFYEPRLSKEARNLHAEEHLVRATSIDDYVAASGIVPDLIKIDAESAEALILQGAARTLRERRPIFTLEIGDCDIEGIPSSRELIQLACSFGYRAFEAADDCIQPHELRDRYTYQNLLFLPV